MRSQRGFTYLGVLFAVALLGLGMAATSELWVTIARRQRQTELEWVGQQFVQAIGSYYESSPGMVKNYPQSFADLLEDKRYLFVRRHLRQVYANPMTGVPDWEIVTGPDGGIRGVKARADKSKREGFFDREFVYVAVGAG